MRAALVDYCVEQKLAGKSYSELKVELLSREVDEEEIKSIFKEADREVLSDVKVEPKSMSILPQGFLAHTLMFLGLALTLASIFLMNGSGIIFFYGPILAGSGLLMRLRNQKLRDRRTKLRSNSNSMWKRNP